MGKLLKRSELENSKSRKGVNGIENTKEDKEEYKEEARQGNRNKEEAGRTGRTASEGQEQKELPRVVFVKDEEQQEPEQLLFEVKESKKKTKTKKKTASKVKDEIKLALVSVYVLAGATLDECFYLKPNEADLLTEAIYRYLEEHNLIHAISEKSALVNLIIALISVNTPKFLEYYKKIKNKEGQQNNDKERQAANDSGQSANRSGRTEYDNSNAKAHLDQFYNPDEG